MKPLKVLTSCKNINLHNTYKKNALTLIENTKNLCDKNPFSRDFYLLRRNIVLKSLHKFHKPLDKTDLVYILQRLNSTLEFDAKRISKEDLNFLIRNEIYDTKFLS